MSEEEFSEDYFRHLLASLTLNSRALISELTSLAENNVEHAQQIVKMTEERIIKILPKYKLYAFYLMDSIIKNIGSPYNLMFSANLHKNFTETYMVIDDTPTRQNLINLFKTWLTGKTIAGSDLFPNDTLQKVEKFIIQATSLNTSDQQDGLKSTRDTVLRESNYLLQYIIALDEEIESATALKEAASKEGEKLYEFKLIRNMMILEINSISEAAISDCKADFEMKKVSYVECLEKARRKLDQQRDGQQCSLNNVRLHATTTQDVSLNHEVIRLNLTAKNFDLLCLLGEKSDETFEAAVAVWGIVDTAKETLLRPALSIPQTQVQKFSSQTLADSLGLKMEVLNPQYHQAEGSDIELELISSTTPFAGDIDGYYPNMDVDEFDQISSHDAGPSIGQSLPGKSSLKRPNLKEERSVKRVRFSV